MAIRKIAYIQRHGKKLNLDGDKSLWRPLSPLTDAAKREIEIVRDRGGFRSGFDEVFSSGLLRADTTAAIMSGQPTPAIELNPHAIWDDKAWGKAFFNADGSAKSTRDILADSADILKPVGLLGANFVRRQIATMDRCQMLFVTHNPIAEAIVAVLTDQWPLQAPFKEFAEGDIVSIDFDENNVCLRHTLHSAASALAPREGIDA